MCVVCTNFRGGKVFVTVATPHRVRSHNSSSSSFMQHQQPIYIHSISTFLPQLVDLIYPFRFLFIDLNCLHRIYWDIAWIQIPYVFIFAISFYYLNMFVIPRAQTVNIVAVAPATLLFELNFPTRLPIWQFPSATQPSQSFGYGKCRQAGPRSFHCSSPQST